MTDLERLNAMLKRNGLPPTTPGKMHSALDALDRKIGRDTRGGHRPNNVYAQYGNPVVKRMNILEGVGLHSQGYEFWLGAADPSLYR